jgi:hypothetical protein
MIANNLHTESSSENGFIKRRLIIWLLILSLLALTLFSYYLYQFTSSALKESTSSQFTQLVMVKIKIINDLLNDRFSDILIRPKAQQNKQRLKKLLLGCKQSNTTLQKHLRNENLKIYNRYSYMALLMPAKILKLY